MRGSRNLSPKTNTKYFSHTINVNKTSGESPPLSVRRKYLEDHANHAKRVLTQNRTSTLRVK